MPSDCIRVNVREKLALNIGSSLNNTSSKKQTSPVNIQFTKLTRATSTLLGSKNILAFEVFLVDAVNGCEIDIFA
jgi:hypothetical protein